MADQVRVFVSHHHSPDEDAFTARLVADLEAAGADVWVDDQRITSDDFIKRINEGLAGRQWLVLVMTPDALRSPWVQAEVNAALNQVRKGRMLGVVPVVAKPCDDVDIPPLLDALHRYDATRAYEPARDGLLRALGSTLTQVYPIPEVPSRLASLGFRGVNVNGTPAIIPPLVTILAGPFLMGSDKAKDPQALDDELPQHWVGVADFQIAKYPVTVAEYALAVHAGAVREPPPEGPREWDWQDTWAKQQERPDRPVVCVTWHDAMTYITWLISATGLRGWRLPTEAQWEKAARWDPRQEASRIYPSGDRFDSLRADLAAPEAGIIYCFSVGINLTGDVPSYASAFGVEDMACNVAEWTASPYMPYPYTSHTDWHRSEERLQSPLQYTARGGPWGTTPERARAAHRIRLNSNDVSTDCGFRLAFSPDVDS